LNENNIEFWERKRCNYPNSLIDKEKAIISDGFLLFAPPLGESYNFNAMIAYSILLKSRFYK
jgi:hypothetical protein